MKQSNEALNIRVGTLNTASAQERATLKMSRFDTDDNPEKENIQVVGLRNF